GVRLVTVDLRWWDTHVLGFDSLRRGFLPRFDRAYSALIEDLDQRGLLESTLVVAWGEFGRTPKVNAQAGRDHYPNVFSAAVAGGGVKGGLVIGESDAKGAFPKTNPKTPQDVLATLYQHLGVDTEAQYLTPSGRPVPVRRRVLDATQRERLDRAIARRRVIQVRLLLVEALRLQIVHQVVGVVRRRMAHGALGLAVEDRLAAHFGFRRLLLVEPAQDV